MDLMCIDLSQKSVSELKLQFRSGFLIAPRPGRGRDLPRTLVQEPRDLIHQDADRPIPQLAVPEPRQASARPGLCRSTQIDHRRHQQAIITYQRE